MPTKRTWMTGELLNRIDFFAMETTSPASELHAELQRDVQDGMGVTQYEVMGLRLLSNRVKDVRQWMQDDYLQYPWNAGTSSTDGKHMVEARKAYFEEHGYMPRPLSRGLALSIIRMVMMFPSMPKGIAFRIGLRFYYAERTRTPTDALTDYITLMPWDSSDNYNTYIKAVEDNTITSFAPWDNKLFVEALAPTTDVIDFKDLYKHIASRKRKVEAVTVKNIMKGWRLFKDEYKKGGS